jgi:cell fate regulator YaaT (PSP1 superfamily)
MAQIVGVRFRFAGRVYYFDPGEFEISLGDRVIVETVRGMELGEVAMGRQEMPDEKVVAPLKKILRLANEEDIERVERNMEKEREAHAICMRKIEQHKLEMKLIDVEYTFDNNKILFYFSADGRVDFRDLVKDLASVFKTRIELRQIGVRDETKMLGGIGICGRCLCCKSFLSEFHPVSIKMAKEQGLSLNPTKISGTCGRLMCCLKYEQDAYEYLLAKTPAVGSIIDTPDGRGSVVGVSLLKGKLKVKLDDGNDTDIVEHMVDDIIVVKAARHASAESGRRGGRNGGDHAAAGQAAAAAGGGGVGVGVGGSQANAIIDADADIDLEELRALEE